MAQTRLHYNGTEYQTTLLRRSYREGGKVRKETVGNLSHLGGWVIDGIKAMLAGKKLVNLEGVRDRALAAAGPCSGAAQRDQAA